MIRHLTAIVVVLSLTPASLAAQTKVFKVTATSANVHKGPSTGSPVIGSAMRGATLEVTRELGSWVKVAWSKAEDRVGYVHVSTGSIARASAPARTRPSASSPASPEGETRVPALPPPPAPPAAPRVAYAERDAAPPPRGYIRTPEHILGVGGRAGGPDFGVGLAARGWSRERFGLQVELSRFTPANDPDRLSTIQLAPSVIYALPDRVFDYWWIRPYVGAGPSLQRRASGSLLPDGSDSLSGTRFGFQVFGGGEFTFASVPRFALSADVGYRQQPFFTGVDSGALGLVVSGHWYVR